MQIYKVIPSNPNIVMVRNTLAVYGGLTVETYSLGNLVSVAKQGGVPYTDGSTGNTAYKIDEAGTGIPSDIALGQLITGALPCWNIFSAAQPGEWRKVGGGSVQGYFRHFLKNDASNAKLNRYAFRLDGFAGHNMDALPPFVSDHLAIHFIRTDSGIQALTTYWNAGLGSYLYENMMGALPCKIGVALFKNGTTYLAQGTVSLSTFPHNGSTQQITINIPSGISITANDTITAKVYLQENNLTSNNDRFFIEEAVTTPTAVEVEDQRTPTFTQQSRFIRYNGTTIYTDSGQAQYIICTGSGLAIGNPSFAVSITPMGFSSSSTYYKHIFVHEWYDGVEVEAMYSHTINNTSWSAGVNYNLSVNVNSLIKGGRSYFIRVVENTSSTPPQE